MLDPDLLLARAQRSGFHRWLLNLVLDRLIPFNQPHGFRLMEISESHIKTSIPYKRKNLNHIKGLHATALATLSEFTTGLLLLKVLGTKNYRIILQRLDIKYLYQGKMDATAEFAIDQDWINDLIIQPLSISGTTVVPCDVKIYDLSGNQLTLATVYWQVKSWDKVKTRV
jgi:acyl-coenzyme A thioesterase PaaI-like protein